MNFRRGRLVALEGIDGCGKSTQARLLAERLGAVLTHEPGATSAGELIRTVVLGRGNPGSPATGVSSALDGRAEALLMMADRAQHVAEVIEPALASGKWVVTDRFSGSTVAYQGYGRGLDVDRLVEISTWAAQGLRPDLCVLVDVDVATAMRRRAGRSGRADGSRRADCSGRAGTDDPGGDRGPRDRSDDAQLDRMESEPEAFREAVARGFAELAAADHDGWVVVDGTGRVADVAECVYDAVVSRIGTP